VSIIEMLFSRAKYLLLACGESFALGSKLISIESFLRTFSSLKFKSSKGETIDEELIDELADYVGLSAVD